MTAATRLSDETVGTVRIGDRDVRRLGFGTMRIASAKDADGNRDRATAIALCRGVAEQGVTFFDTANIYGYGECEEIIAEALHPYAQDLVITTKAGFKPGKMYPGMSRLPALGTPEHIREECDKSLARLRLDHIELYQVHVPDPAVPYAETVGAFADLQRAGKVKHIGVSNVDLEHLAIARGVCAVVSVQNSYSLANRASEDVLTECEKSGIAFIPHTPAIRSGSPVAAAVDEVAAELGASAPQVAIAWLLARSPVMLPIPGTRRLAHAIENAQAGRVELTPAQFARLDKASGSL
ncbi:MAG TPA: aldo/keto reductase [Amycolatopsis sp.]|nr:aldo/keto reductase [Amycolatopsis sp.]